MATGISPSRGRSVPAGGLASGCHCLGLVLVLLILLITWSFALKLNAETNGLHSLPRTPDGFKTFARSEYLKADAELKKDPSDAAAAWNFGRTCFDLAEWATNKQERVELAQKGIDACQAAIAKAPDQAPPHYYLGMNLGQLARTRTLGALKLVTQMRKEFELALAKDEGFDHAGPDRNLGLLYRDAPSFGSIGDRRQAQTHLERAAQLQGDYPENRLNLCESYLKWGDRGSAERELKALLKDWETAHSRFNGPEWAASWADWQPRLAAVRKKLE